MPFVSPSYGSGSACNREACVSSGGASGQEKAGPFLVHPLTYLANGIDAVFIDTQILVRASSPGKGWDATARELKSKKGKGNSSVNMLDPDGAYNGNSIYPTAWM